ncbi:ABC transporter permease [Rhodococcus koreensis]|uniref:ABC transporter permease n=2 Tax=Rhodococcus TaxID=1827 RepID=UPI0036D9BE75
MSAAITASRRVRVSRRLHRSRMVRRMLADKAGIFSLIIVILICTIGLLSLVWTPYDPLASDLQARLEGPSAAHWLGTDTVGRDILSRLMVATWVTMKAIAIAIAIALGFGMVIGVLAGYLEGITDAVTSRFNDVLMALPPVLFAVAIVGVLGSGLTNAMIAIGILLLPRFLRLSRLTTLESKHEDFVEAARCSGAGPARILIRHILPGSTSVLLVQTSLAAAVAVIGEASLSFLGLGVQPPTPSWGSMTKDGFDILSTSAWSILPPSVMLIAVVLALSVLGDSLRDASGR